MDKVPHDDDNNSNSIVSRATATNSIEVTTIVPAMMMIASISFCPQGLVRKFQLWKFQ